MTERSPNQPPKPDGPSEALVRACNEANEFIRTTVFPAIRQAEQGLRKACEIVQTKIERGLSLEQQDVDEIKNAMTTAEKTFGNSFSGNYQNRIIKVLAELRMHRMYHQLRQDEPLSDGGPTSFLLALREFLAGAPQKPQYKFTPVDTQQLLLRPEELSQKKYDIGGAVSERIFMNQKKSKDSGVTLMTTDLLSNRKEQILLVHHIRELSAEALDELLRNAFDATARGGNITVSVERQGGAAVITVSDTGKGIAPEDLPHIFEKKFTTKTTGTGRGLGLVKEYFEDILGGKIEVKSIVDVGTTITIRLPLAKNV